MSTTETATYTNHTVTTLTGKKVRWSGRAIGQGQWPEYPDSAYSIEIYETKNQTLVVWITDVRQGLNDVVSADDNPDLIESLEQHEWANEESFMAALQNTFPDEDIWVEEIE
jgi:hypothetical protein